jgi:hypothetical protein
MALLHTFYIRGDKMIKTKLETAKDSGSAVTMTITEALAELRLIPKVITSREAAIYANITRLSDKVDPMSAEGGQPVHIERMLQSIRDLNDYRMNIREAIEDSNATTEVTIAGHTHTVAWWLRWQREVEPEQKELFVSIQAKIDVARREMAMAMNRIASPDAQAKVPQVVTNIAEDKLRQMSEELLVIESELDGKLTLSNSVTTITIHP